MNTQRLAPTEECIMKNAQIRAYFLRNHRASSTVYALYMSSAARGFLGKEAEYGRFHPQGEQSQ